MDIDGHKVSGKRAIAHMMWELATTRQVTFPDGAVLQAGADAWLDTVKWLYQHIDGPAKAGLDVTSNGETLNQAPDLSNLTDEELIVAKQLARKARGLDG